MPELSKLPGTVLLSFIIEKTFEPLRREFGVPRRVLDVAVAQPLLQGAGVVAVVVELEAAGVPEHVRVDGKREFGRVADPCEQLPEGGHGQRPFALADEHVGRAADLLALDAPQGAYLVAADQVHARPTVLAP